MQKGITIFRWRIFVSVPKNIVGEPFCVSQNFWYRKILCLREGEGREGVSRFSVKNFCLTVPKFRKETLQCFTNFGYRKFLCLTGLCQDFLSIFFVSLYRKISYENRPVLCFKKLSLAKKLMDDRGGGGERGECQDFTSKIFWLPVPRNFLEAPFCAVFQKISDSEKVFR